MRKTPLHIVAKYDNSEIAAMLLAKPYIDTTIKDMVIFIFLTN